MLNIFIPSDLSRLKIFYIRAYSLKKYCGVKEKQKSKLYFFIVVMFNSYFIYILVYFDLL